MKSKSEVLTKQGDFFFRIGELTFAGLAVGGFVAWAFEGKINALQLVGIGAIGILAVIGCFYWGSKLYEKSIEQEDK